MSDLGEQMRDPAYQRDMALMLQAMTEVLLDMPVAPLAQAAAEMVGEETRDIDPDLTLRRIPARDPEIAYRDSEPAPLPAQIIATRRIGDRRILPPSTRLLNQNSKPEYTSMTPPFSAALSTSSTSGFDRSGTARPMSMKPILLIEL